MTSLVIPDSPFVSGRKDASQAALKVQIRMSFDSSVSESRALLLYPLISSFAIEESLKESAQEALRKCAPMMSAQQKVCLQIQL